MTRVVIPKKPFIDCGPPVVDESFSFPLPFGLPEANIPGECDAAIDALGALLAQLSFLSPILKLAGCVMGVVNVINGILDMFSIPPNFDKFKSAVEALGGCITFLSSATYTTPVAIAEMLRFIRGIIESLLKILTCVYTMSYELVVQIEEAQRLSESSEGSLRQMGECLNKENQRLEHTLSDKLKKVQGLITLVNLVLSIVGSIVGIDATIPSAGNIPTSREELEALAQVSNALTEVLGKIPQV